MLDTTLLKTLPILLSTSMAMVRNPAHSTEYQHGHSTEYQYGHSTEYQYGHGT